MSERSACKKHKNGALDKRFALLASTNGSVVKTVHALAPAGKFRLDLIVSDRECGALSLGSEHGIPTHLLNHKDGHDFSCHLLDLLRKESIDYVYVFFSRLLHGRLLDEYAGRLINFHPSLLPACPGLHGFEDSIESGALIAGSTVHFVDKGMDTGRKILQTFTATHQKKTEAIRHEIFAQQCAALMDTHLRLDKGLPLLPKDRPSSPTLSGFVPEVAEIALDIYRAISARGSPTGNV